MNRRLTQFTATLALATATLLAACSTRTGFSQNPPPRPKERIGVYDSRAIAVAYAGSAFQQQKMKDLTARHQQAKAAGDTKETARLEAEGQAWQAALHRQGFGTAPVDDLLAHIASELPRLRETAGVTTLLSKWNQPELAKHPQAERVDVTMQLVDAFRPTETQRKRALEIQQHRPVSVKD
ncbi:MAG: hypothetical protein FD161_2750 [Limisphaerales bacterium]|nr:MAG: hypothetical protein FD161_2750 [Limisphaerales bacterium]KAG0508248.1 MAG: hypothetical protein E1N63_2501 [Limisphaerales bacterium]TXT49563.1 MAG: hypothetical protein FD140_2889 [Limisphaerales bacterium]